MRRTILLCCAALAGFAMPMKAQRRPVLPQIDEPHPYYYRELYLPQLTSGPSSLTWGPDSKELIYSMAGSLWRQKLDSKEAMQLTDGAGYDYQPDWSPDGKAVVYASYQKDAMELWLLDLASGKTRQLTSGGAVNVEPRWSPDGRKLVWVSTQYNRRFHVFMAEFADGALKNVKRRLTGETKSDLPRYYYSAYDMEINPVWTRDGKEILFVSNRGHIHGTGGFWLVKAEPGAEAREIHYEETNWKARPDFSPDGSRMVYSSYLGGPYENLWLMSAKGGDAFPLTYGAALSSQVRWSPDGRYIAYVGRPLGISQIWLVSVPDGKQQEFDVDQLRYLRARVAMDIDVRDEKDQKTLARISVTDEMGKFYAPQDEFVHADDAYDRSKSPFEAHYFYMRRRNYLDVPKGRIEVRVSKGLEYEPVFRRLDLSSVREGQRTEVRVDLKRGDWLKDEPSGWVGGDLHVHENYGGNYQFGPAELLDVAEGEDIRIVNNLLVNKEQRFPDIDSLRFDTRNASRPDTIYVKGQEFHTSYWGHRGLLRLKEHLLLPGYAGYPNTAAASLYPMNADVYDMAHSQGALVGAVHPFDEVPDPFAKPAQRITDELPVDVALGKLDYMEIVGFSDHKSTAAVWYKLLNLGFKIPAGGGTDATTNYAAPIRGQVGFDRVYVWMPQWPGSIDLWLDELKQGRTFATNGPLIEFKLGGEMVGSELKFDTPQTAVPFSVKLRAIVPVDHLEVVCNGKVAQSLKLEGDRESADVTGTIPLRESGWCVLRAWSEKAEYPVMDNYEYATTSPVYATIGEKRAYSKEDAQYFIAWINRTIEITDAYPDWNSAQEKEKVMQKLREAKEIFEEMK